MIQQKVQEIINLSKSVFLDHLNASNLSDEFKQQFENFLTDQAGLCLARYLQLLEEELSNLKDEALNDKIEEIIKGTKKVITLFLLKSIIKDSDKIEEELNDLQNK